MDNKTRFYRLKGQTKFEIETFINRLDQLEAEQYPSNIANCLIKCVLDNLNNYLTVITRIDSDFPYDEIGAISRLQSLRNNITLHLCPYLNWIEGARTRMVPWSIIPLFEKLSKALYKGDKKVLISCTNCETYRIAWYKNNVNCLCEFCILEIPSLLKLDALNHINMAHEIFHPIVDDFISMKQPDFLQKIHYSIKNSNLINNSSVKLHELVESARKIWEGAIKEIMCDMGCVALFGPAGFLSLGDTAVTMDLDQLPMPDSFHPPWRFRIRTLLKYAFKYGEKDSCLNLVDTELRKNRETRDIADSLKKEFKLFYDVAIINTDLNKIKSRSQIYSLAYEEVNINLNDAWVHILKLCINSPFLWENAINQIASLIGLLRVPAPPGEIVSLNNNNTIAPCPSSIANAAWMFQLASRKIKYGGKDEIKLNYRTFSKLVLKAFENVELKLHYDALNKENCSK